MCKITLRLMLILVAVVNESFLSFIAGLKATNGDAFSNTWLASGGVAVEGGVDDDGEGSVQMLQRENGHLQEQLRSSEELNATLRSELDLTRSILKHNPQTEDKQPEQQNTSASKTINSGRVREL